MGFLEIVEGIIANKQRQIAELRRERDRALDEVQNLTEMLDVVLTRADELQARDHGRGLDEMEKLLGRLN